MLKSSSTPVLGSLIPSFSDSPNNNNHTSNSKILCTNTNNNNNSFRKPIFRSPSLPETKLASTGFRRVQSEGNLEELANTDDEFSLSKHKPPKRSNFCTLDTIPSFSFRHSGTRLEDEDSDDDEEFESDQFQVRNIQNLVSRSNIDVNNNDYGGLRFGDIDEAASAGKMYLAAGLGVSTYGGGGGGGGRGCRPVDFDRDGGDVSMEDYYKRMLQENPGDALFLRNYAQFLYQKKRDLGRAEEYYSRAILADPNDGEILSQYAKLIWELHHDKERATYYFERAAQASSEDSHVHAAFASFLWDTEEENDAADNFTAGQQLFHHGFMASATA